MKSKYIYSVITLFLIAFFGVTAFTGSSQEGNEKSNEDIIKFSHSLHTQMTDCASCHSGVTESTSLSDDLLPQGHESCQSCHDMEDAENCNQCHYEDNYEPLQSSKSELMFNHKFHTQEQGMECESCHQGFDEVDYGFQAAQANPPMENCYECHDNESVASNACESCHVSTANLIPKDHQTANFFTNHKWTAMDEEENCQMCHDDTFCEDCHVATVGITEDNTSRDFYAPYVPHNYTDGTKQQQLNRVHDLNYRYTHGMDAKGKTSECQTCHQTETFCAECHSAGGGDYALGGVVPVSHTQPNFSTFGVGSGGGEHAELAKRDIESCAACHDTQGSDPVCITCHMDNDGIQGTNPKTHKNNFMSDNNGDWHNTQASVCYNCHVDANARPSGTPGVGFCGYCHGGK